MLDSRKEFLEIQAISEWCFNQYCYVTWQIHKSVFLGFSILQYFIIDDKIGKNIFSRMAFPKKKYKKANFPRWMKEIFFVKKKKMKKRKKNS